jgi:hypothetical protein
MLRVVAALCVVAASVAVAQIAGGENFGVPVAPLPIPHDKCSVAATNDADMRLTVFTWGYNNAFWMSKQDENWGAMSEWKTLGGFFAGGPTVVRNANNDITLFGRGADKRVYYTVFGADAVPAEGEVEWIDLGGQNVLSSRPTAIVDPQGLIHVFVRAADSKIWEKRQFANGTEAVWGEWTSLGGLLSGEPAAIVDAEGVTHLFARGVDGGLWSMTQKLEEDGSLTWVAWTKSENSVYLSSAAVIVPKLNAQNLVEVVVRGADKAFWHTRQTVNDERGLVWSPWKSLGGIFSSAPAVQMNSDSLLTVYGRGPEKGVWYKQQAHHPVDSPSDTWSKWVPLGGRFTASIDAIPDSRGYINIFGRGLDKSIWSRGQVYSNKTVGFFGPWQQMGGRFRAFPC